MIDSPFLLSTLKGQLTDLLADLHRQVDTVPEIDERAAIASTNGPSTPNAPAGPSPSGPRTVSPR